MASGGGQNPGMSTPREGGTPPSSEVYIFPPYTAYVGDDDSVRNAMRRARAIQRGDASGLAELPAVSNEARAAIENAALPIRKKAVLEPEVKPDEHTIFIF